MQHIKAKNWQELFGLQDSIVRKNVRQHHPKRPTKGDSMVSKKVRFSRETKKVLESKLIKKF